MANVKEPGGKPERFLETRKSLIKRLAASEMQNRQLQAENTKLSADLQLNQQVLAEAEQQRVALVQRVRDEGDLTEEMEETIALADANQERHQGDNSNRQILSDHDTTTDYDC